MSRRAVWLSMFLGAVVVGCGDDGGGPPADPNPTPTMDAGTTPQPDATTNAGTTAPPTNMTAMPVPCGANTCQPRANPLDALGDLGGALGPLLSAFPMPVTCCVDQAAGTCGIAMNAGATCEELATADTRCPSIDLGPLSALAGNMGFGCCTAEGMCGVDGSTFGRGCVENEEATTMLAAAGLGAFLMVPQPRGCDDVGDGGIPDDDAGL